MSHRLLARAVVVVVALVALLPPCAVARAQSRSTSFDAENFHPSTTSQGYFAVD